jgi:hypothetical protein
VSPQVDQRSAERRARDERIASEPPLQPPQLPPNASPMPLEDHLRKRHRRPVAVAGIVENGLVRPLDPAIVLPEHSRVIIVAAEET